MLFFLHLSWCVVKPLDIRDSSIRGKDRYFDEMHEICIQSTVVTFFQEWWSGGQEKNHLYEISSRFYYFYTPKITQICYSKIQGGRFGEYSGL